MRQSLDYASKLFTQKWDYSIYTSLEREHLLLPDSIQQNRGHGPSSVTHHRRQLFTTSALIPCRYATIFRLCFQVESKLFTQKWDYSIYTALERGRLLLPDSIQQSRGHGPSSVTRHGRQ